MEKEVKLFVGQDELDIYDDAKLKLAMTYSIANINNITSRSGSFSKTLTIPASPRNKKAFGFVEEVNSTTGFDQTEIRDGRIDIDGFTMLQGVVKITDAVPDKKGNVTEYKIVMLGENGDWKNLIRGLELRDLDFSDQDHTYDKATIDASETIAVGRHYVYPLESRGDFKIEIEFNVTSMIWQVGTTVRCTFPGGTDLSWVKPGNTISISGAFFDVNNGVFVILAVNDGADWIEINHPDNDFGVFDEVAGGRPGVIVRKNAVGVNDRYPATNVREVLNRIFLEAGYTIESNFYDSDFFKRQYLTFTGETFRRRDGFEDNEEFRAGYLADFTTPQNVNDLIFPDDSTGKNFDNGMNYDTTTGIYTVSQRARMRFLVNLLAKAPNPIGVLINVRVNGNSGGSFQNIFQVGTSNTNILFGTPYLNLKAGDTVQVRIQGVNITLDKDGTSFYNEVKPDVIRDGPVDLAATLPDMKQVDFIKGLKELYNLYFTTDVANKVVSFEPRDDFFNGKVQDWTDKLDHDNEQNVSFLGADLNKTIEYTYSQDGNDALVNALNQENDISFGAHRFDIANVFGKDGIGKRENPIFAATLMAPANYIGMITSPMPRMWKEKEPIPTKSTDFMPRILYYAGVVDADEGDKWVFESDTRTTYPYMYSYNDRVENSNSLMYDDRLRSNGLFQRYFRNLHSQIDKGRKFTGRFYLDEKTISRLNFREPILLTLDGEPSLWHLNKISNHNPILRRTTKVELIKITDDAPVPQVSSEITEPAQPNEDNTPQEELVLAKVFIDKEGNFKMSGNNISNVLEALMLGDNLTASKYNQIVIGKNNEPDEEAAFIIGAGLPGNPKNLLAVDGGGGLKVGSGYIYADINQLTMPVYYTNSNGDTKLVQK